MKIEGKRIYFKNLTEKDATKRYCQWLNDPEVNRYLETKAATVEGLREYIKTKNEDPNSLFLGIFFKKNNQHIGNIKLEPLNFKKKKAFLGLLIGDKNYWGIGIGTEATKLIVDHCFYELNLDKAEAAMIAENIGSFKIHEKLGFKVDKIENNIISMSINSKLWQSKRN